MALLPCLECSREVSNQAAVRPHCGYPLQARPAAASPAPAADLDHQLTQVLLSQGKINAIKLCRELRPGLGLAEAKQHVDRLQAALPEVLRQRTGGGGAGCLLLLPMLTGGCWG